MLLGKDSTIPDICPAYLTNTLLRKVNVDRYDDRETVKTNLIESYDLLMGFVRKHLPDKFWGGGGDVNRVSLRDILAREMVSNTLIHREFSNSYMEKFVIEKDRMYAENANHALGAGVIRTENLEPNPKKPIIAAFFRMIRLADNLGLGIRKMFKYRRYYSGKDSEFQEGDVFRISVPLDDGYYFDYGLIGQRKETDQTDQSNQTKLNDDEIFLLNVIKTDPELTNRILAENWGG